MGNSCKKYKPTKTDNNETHNNSVIVDTDKNKNLNTAVDTSDDNMIDINLCDKDSDLDLPSNTMLWRTYTQTYAS